MTKKRALIILGVFIAIVPFLGIPREFREVLTVLAGLTVAVLAFLLKRRLQAEAMRNDTFVQNGPTPNAPPNLSLSSPTDGISRPVI